MATLDALIRYVRDEATEGLRGNFQCYLTREGEAEPVPYYLVIQDDEVGYRKGVFGGRADFTLRCSEADFLALATGELNAAFGFMKGKLKVAGKLPLALKAEALYRKKNGPEIAKLVLAQARL